MTRTTIASITTGKRLIAGTEWPVYSYVERETWIDPISKKRKYEYRLVKSLCNGVPSGTEIFKTKKDALKALEEYTGQKIN